jgi:hypothetical protein
MLLYMRTSDAPQTPREKFKNPLQYTKSIQNSAKGSIAPRVTIVNGTTLEEFWSLFWGVPEGPEKTFETTKIPTFQH